MRSANGPHFDIGPDFMVHWTWCADRFRTALIWSMRSSDLAAVAQEARRDLPRVGELSLRGRLALGLRGPPNLRGSFGQDRGDFLPLGEWHSARRTQADSLRWLRLIDRLHDWGGDFGAATYAVAQGELESDGRTPVATLEEIRRWPATVGVPQASEQELGTSRSWGYALAAAGEFPARRSRSVDGRAWYWVAHPTARRRRAMSPPGARKPPGGHRAALSKIADLDADCAA